MHASVLLLLACMAYPMQGSFARSDQAITKVHVVVSNHLDIGFHSNTGDLPGTDLNVLNKYFTEYFPAAIRVANQLKSNDSVTDSLRYMTHSYLVSLYLDCPERIGVTCPSLQEVSAFEEAVRAGDILWHAFPHNAQMELFDPDLLRFALQLTHDLDQRFDLPAKTVVSQRDVPGLTRAAVPILARNGVKAISVGVNGGSAPPDVPKNTPFIWRDESSGEELIAFWHKGGYSDYVIGNTGPTLDAEPCTRVPEYDQVVCTAWKGDNEGPPSVEELLQTFDRIREDFPGAEVVASSFDAFIESLQEALDGAEESGNGISLPVVTAEIGDTWIGGISSDPGKVAEYKALLRARRESKDRWDDPAYIAFSRMLLKIPEHTWGVDTKQDPGDFENWSNAAFQQALDDKEPHFMNAVAAWKRQRQYLQWAMEELGPGLSNTLNADHTFNTLDALEQELEAMHTAPDPAELEALGFVQVSVGELEDRNDPAVYHSHAWGVELDKQTGSIIGLDFYGSEGKIKGFDVGGGGRFSEGLIQGRKGQEVVWASKDSPMPQVMYSTYAEESYDILWKEYAYQPWLPEWFYKDFGKPNATEVGGAKRADYLPHLDNIWHHRQQGGGLHLFIRSSFDEEAVREAGAPKHMWIEIKSPAESEDLYVDVVWHKKTATRLPETLWVQWQPNPDSVDVNSWVMHKLGSPISPLEVLRNGSYSLHAVGDEGIGVNLAGGKYDTNSSRKKEGMFGCKDDATLNIRSLDAPLVSPGKPDPFENVKHLPDLEQGMSFSLVNNIWGTNYVMWVPYLDLDGTMRFRFVLQIDEGCDAGMAEV